MKKIYKIALGVLFVNVLAMAGSGIHISAGLNMSKLSFSEDLGEGVDEKMRMGFNAGAAYELAITDMFSVVPGLAIETRGQVREMSIDAIPELNIPAQDLEYKINLMYLEIPILAQANIPAGPGFVNLFAGPEIGILLSAKTDDGDTEEDFKDDVKTLDIGITAGAGFEFPAGPGSVIIRPSYSLGLTNINDSEADPEFPEEEPVEIKNTNIKLAVGYKISL